MPRNLVILGSTGSIGTQTLEVVREFPDRLRVVGLAAGKNARLLGDQIDEFHPMFACAEVDITTSHCATTMLAAEQGMIEMACHPDTELVVVATVGSAGLLPTLAALDAGKQVALANKEVLVSAGALIEERVRGGTGTLVPIDSEHSAVWQCLQGEPSHSIERITLTASGGALRHVDPADLAQVTPDEALRHPTWNMGTKITIDSATLMNKGLEVLEARWLFDVPLEDIDVVLHAQSIVHSMVTFSDGSTKAQLGVPNMRLPIQYALSHPERWANRLERLQSQLMPALDFAPLERNRYPCLDLALWAGSLGGTYPAALCAGDEVAVDAFLHGKIRFTDIPTVVERALSGAKGAWLPALDGILDADLQARQDAMAAVARL